ncbi:unnamed protein product [Rhizopus stolonifer]
MLLIRYVLFLSCFFSFILVIQGKPSSVLSSTPLNADQIYDILNRGYEYEKQLLIRKKHLLESIEAVHGESNDEFYALAGVQLDNFQALQSFAVGILEFMKKQ